MGRQRLARIGSETRTLQKEIGDWSGVELVVVDFFEWKRVALWVAAVLSVSLVKQLLLLKKLVVMQMIFVVAVADFRSGATRPANRTGILYYLPNTQSSRN